MLDILLSECWVHLANGVDLLKKIGGFLVILIILIILNNKFIIIANIYVSTDVTSIDF